MIIKYESNKLEYHNFPLFAIKTTPVIIITVAIIICGVLASLSIAHPKITATTGLTYAKVLANDADVFLRTQKNPAHPTEPTVMRYNSEVMDGIEIEDT